MSTRTPRQSRRFGRRHEQEMRSAAVVIELAMMLVALGGCPAGEEEIGSCASDGAPPGCVEGRDGICSDLITGPSATCHNGAWRCPGAKVPTTECRCYGGGLGCTCGPNGWICGRYDAGTRGSASDAPADPADTVPRTP